MASVDVAVARSSTAAPGAGRRSVQAGDSAAEGGAGREQMAHLGPAYGAALESGVPSLVAQLEERLAARAEGGAPEPELAAPRPDGPAGRRGPAFLPLP